MIFLNYSEKTNERAKKTVEILKSKCYDYNSQKDTNDTGFFITKIKRR